MTLTAIQFLQGLPRDLQIFFPFFRILVKAVDQHGVIGGIGHGDGGFQLVGHVAGEVGLHFVQLALLAQGPHH